MLKPETVKKVVSVWNILFGGQRSQAEQAVICAKYYQAFSPIYNDKTFLLAAEMVEKEVKFFPTIKDIIDVRESVQQISESKPSDYSLTAITDDAGEMTPEIIEQNMQRMKVINDMLAGKMSMDDAVAEQAKLKTYARR